MSKNATDILKEWSQEFETTVEINQSFFIAEFTINGALLYRNEAMSGLLGQDAKSRLINPSFEQIISYPSKSGKLFEGHLTIGDFKSINTSIFSQIYRKDDKILILGGVNASQLLENNNIMHQLNREIISLQRQVIKEKNTLNSTLEQLNTLNTELKGHIDDKDKFISILAHDLKSPFTALIGFSDQLVHDSDDIDDEMTKRYHHLLNRNIHKTYQLLEDILTWSRSHSSQAHFEPKRTSIKQSCTKAIEQVKSTADLKNVKIIQTCNREYFIYADQNMLKTIFRNLINNAIKYCHEDGEIVISGKEKNNILEVCISDNGVGMSKATLEGIWKSNHSSKKGTKGEKGTGFGLNITKEFVEKHGQKIWVESIVGKGSRFYFTMQLD